MTRYFFDVKVKTLIEHDHIGNMLYTREQARELADFLAADLCCTRPDDAIGMEVQIRTSDGALVSSVPVNLMECLPA